MFAMILTSVSIVAAAAQADSESLKITDAWVPAAEKSGSDVPLLMTIRNDSSSPDALMRVRCAAANFSEKHTVDRGEGALRTCFKPTDENWAAGFALRTDGGQCRGVIPQRGALVSLTRMLLSLS
jgi:hypothetical protein